MKVLFVTKNYHPGAGDRTYMFALERLLGEHGHQVAYFAMDHPLNLATTYSRYFVSRIDFREALRTKRLTEAVRVIGRSIYSVESKSKMTQLLEYFHPDVVHIQHLDQHVSYSILPVIKKMSIPIVWTLHIYSPICINHNLMDERTGEICESCRPSRFYQATRRRCKRGRFLPSLLGSVGQYFNYLMRFRELVDAFLCPSDFVRNKFLDFGFPGDRLHTVRNFIDIREFELQPSAAGYGLFLGRLVREKGGDLLVKALGGTDIPFKIVGDGPEMQTLRNSAELAGLRTLEFTGYKTGEGLSKILDGASFVVVPSQWYDVAPLVILEALAHGKPVIGSRIGGIPELIEDGETGFLFDPASPVDLRQKMLRLHSNPELVRDMGRKAKANVEDKFNPERHYRALMEIYSSVRR